MSSRHLQNTTQSIDPRDEIIPPHCTPPPLTSSFGRQIFEQNRRMSFGSSPSLKRGSDQLGSPNSPQSIREPKKNKNKEELASEIPETLL
jgi:hypothetical protein